MFTAVMPERDFVAFDVDDTLTVGNVPRTSVVNLCRAMYESGLFDVIIWSGGGADYARMWRDRCKLPEEISCYHKSDPTLRKPDIAFDDSPDFKNAYKVIRVQVGLPLPHYRHGGSTYKRCKEYLIWRDGTACHWCDRILEYSEVTIDHYFPWCLWLGTIEEFNAVSNLVVCCQPCNMIKGNKNPITFRRYPDATGIRKIWVWFLRKRGRIKKFIKELTRPELPDTVKS